MTKTYADIIVDITSEKLDRSFQYLVPQHLEGKLQPGMQVQVPFGNGGRMIKGYVIRVTDQPSFDVSRMKEIREVETGSNSIESRLIALAAWMRENFGGTMNQALKTVIPVKQKTTEKEKRMIWLKPDAATAKAQLGELQRKHQTARARLMEALLKQSPLPYDTEAEYYSFCDPCHAGAGADPCGTHPKLAQSAGSDEKAGKHCFPESDAATRCG